MGSQACAAAAHRVQPTTLPADNDTYFHVHSICCISGLLSGAASCSDCCTFYSCVGISVTMGTRALPADGRLEETHDLRNITILLMLTQHAFLDKIDHQDLC